MEPEYSGLIYAQQHMILCPNMLESFMQQIKGSCAYKKKTRLMGQKNYTSYNKMGRV